MVTSDEIIAGPAPWTEPQPPMSRRRKLLIAAIAVLSAGVLAAAVALLNTAAGVVPGPVGEQGGTASDIAECSGTRADDIARWVRLEQRRITARYGESRTVVAGPWVTADDFPVAAFAWAHVTPDCGASMVLDGDTRWLYRAYVESVSHRQFESVSSMLTAMGYLMVLDDVPHSELGDDDEDSADDGADDPVPSLEREFQRADGVTVRLALAIDDYGDLDATGDLTIEFAPAAGSAGLVEAGTRG